jgi:hypothetical protein
MNASESAPSVEPLALLEARVRWLTALCAFLTLGLLALVAWQFTPRPKVIEANAFVLRDHQWKRRGELGLREDGSPMLRLNGVTGQERLMISARDDGRGTIRLTDPAGVFRLRLALDPQGRPFIALAGPDGRPRVAIAAGEGSTTAALFDDAGKKIWSAP